MKKLNAYPLYLIMQGVSAYAFSMIFTIAAIYLVQIVGMNPLQLVLVGTALELTAFIFEVPTGVIADSYSRRLSVIIGQLVLGVGFMLEGLAPVFMAIIASQVICGIGYTFISGALDAWIADELGVENIGRVYARAQQAGVVGALLGIISSAGLATVALNLPIVLGGLILFLLGLALALLMPETGFKPAPRQARTTRQMMGRTLGDGVRVVRGSTLLIILMAAGVVYGAFTEGFDRLNEAHILIDIGLPALGALQPVVWFGIINVIGLLLRLGVSEVVRRRVDMTRNANSGLILFVLHGLLGLSVIGFGLAGNFGVAVLALWLAGAFRTAADPVSAAWLNQHVRSEVRATVLSMRNQADALGQVAGGPALGMIGTVFSIRAALVVGGLLITPALWLYARTFKPTISPVPGATLVEETS